MVVYVVLALGPVSYTHLDVYKRQAEDDAEAAEAEVELWRSRALR